MDQTTIQTFINVVQNIFENLSRPKSESEIKTPYILDSEELNKITFDYSGIIEVSGQNSGVAMLTLPKSMVVEILSLKGTSIINGDLMMDCVGELANQICGNCRKYFGAGFKISIPKKFEQNVPKELFTPHGSKVCVIPINWKSPNSSYYGGKKQIANLVISIKGVSSGAAA